MFQAYFQEPKVLYFFIGKVCIYGLISVLIWICYTICRVANPIQSNRQSNPIDPYLDNRKSKVGQSIIRFTIQSK